MNHARQRIQGLAALIALLAIILGLPALLIATGPTPLPTGWPTTDSLWRILTTSADAAFLLGVIRWTAWAAWGFLTISIIVEIASRARGIRAPRLPALTAPQQLARALVTAAALLFAAPLAATAAPVVTTTATAPAAPGVPGAVHSQEARATAPAAETAAGNTVKHKVVPGESLWSIAATHLGDPTRYKEIVQLNPHVLHGKADFLEAGWILNLPAPAHRAVETVIVQPGDTLSEIALEKLGDASRYPEIYLASRTITQPDGEHLTDPDEIDVGWKLRVPHTDPTAQPGPPANHPANPHTQPRSGPGPSATRAPAAPATPQPSTTTTPTAAPSQPHTAPPSGQSAPNSDTPAAALPAVPATPQASQPAHDSATSTSSVGQPASTASDSTASEDPTWWTTRTATGIGALMAAGVIGLIGARRRIQHRRRRAGQAIPMPEPGSPEAKFEHELRAAADPISVEVIDQALRALAASCIDTNTTLPEIRAARLTQDHFTLYLDEQPEQPLPAPWAATADPAIWTLPVDTTSDDMPRHIDNVVAPYPALTTIGQDLEGGHVLIDLEHAGTLTITPGGDFDPDTPRCIMASLAVELATSTWADDLQVTVVGDFPDLEDHLQTGRIRYLPSAGRILDHLHARADADRAAMAHDGADTLHNARLSGAAPDVWTPEIVLLTGAVTGEQRRQLQSLVDQLPRVALAAVTTGEPVGEWSLNLAAGKEGHPGSALLTPFGLHVRPQLLPAKQYDQLLTVASLADPDEIDEIDEIDDQNTPEPTLQDVEALADVEEPYAEQAPPEAARLPTGETEAHAEHVVDVDDAPSSQAQPDDQPSEPLAAEIGVDEASASEPAVDEEPAYTLAPRVLVLGPVDLLNAPGPVEPNRRARLLELAAYLVIHPGAPHSAIDDAIWPNRTTEENWKTRNPATTKLRRWVGTAADGREYLPRHQAGDGYRFDDEIRSDLDDWTQLLSDEGPLHAPTENLEAALRLIRGRPFEGHHRRSYAWAEPIIHRVIGEIVDASYELARRRIMEGRWRAAEDAVVIGLRVEPAQERLWRMRILAAHESRSAAAQAEAIDRLLTITEELECELEPETQQLLDALQGPRDHIEQIIANA